MCYWPLSMPKRRLEARFRRRHIEHGPLVLISAKNLLWLCKRAELTSKQLELPLDYEECKA